MMKFFIFITLLASLAIVPIFSARAAIKEGTIPGADALGIQASPITSASSFLTILAKIVKWTYDVFFVVAVFFILIAAFYFLTAADNAERVKTARTMIMYAVIAIAVALIAVGASVIVKSILGEKSAEQIHNNFQQQQQQIPRDYQDVQPAPKPKPMPEA